MIGVALIGGVDKNFFPFSLYNCRALIDPGRGSVLDSMLDSSGLRDSFEKVYLLASYRYAGAVELYMKSSENEYEVFYDAGNLGSGGALKNFIKENHIEDDRIFLFFDNSYFEGIGYDFGGDSPITAYTVAPDAASIYLIDSDFIKYSPDGKRFGIADMLSIYSQFREYKEVNLNPAYYKRLRVPESVTVLRKDILEQKRQGIKFN